MTLPPLVSNITLLRFLNKHLKGLFIRFTAGIAFKSEYDGTGGQSEGDDDEDEAKKMSIMEAKYLFKYNTEISMEELNANKLVGLYDYDGSFLCA